MSPLESFGSVEKIDTKKEAKEKPFVPYKPKEQLIQWCISLIEKEYEEAHQKQLPDEVKTLLAKAVTGKSQEERDYILDMITETIQGSDDTTELIYFLETQIWKESENEIETKQTKFEVNQAEYEQASFKLFNSLSSLNWEWKSYGSLLNRIKSLYNFARTDWFNEAFDKELSSILTELENPEILLAISLDLQREDEKNWTKHYEEFKSAIISLNPSFESKFPDTHLKAMIAGFNDFRNTIYSTGIPADIVGSGYRVGMANAQQLGIQSASALGVLEIFGMFQNITAPSAIMRRFTLSADNIFVQIGINSDTWSSWVKPFADGNFGVGTVLSSGIGNVNRVAYNGFAYSSTAATDTPFGTGTTGQAFIIAQQRSEQLWANILIARGLSRAGIRKNNSGTPEWLEFVFQDTIQTLTGKLFGSNILPNTTNSIDLGAASARMRDMFLTNAVNVLSNAQHKQDIRPLNEQEIACATELASNVSLFRWKSAVQEKGEAARIHTGMIAQEVVTIFLKHGLNPNAYGLLCYDSWEAEIVEHPAEYEQIEIPAVIGEDGNEIEPVRYEQGELINEAWTETVREAGEAYSLRSEELLYFMMAGQEARLSAIEEKLKTL